MVRMLIKKHEIAPVLAQLKLVYTANTTQLAEAALYSIQIYNWYKISFTKLYKSINLQS